MSEIARTPTVQPGRKTSPVRITTADGTVTEQPIYDSRQLGRIDQGKVPGLKSAQLRALRKAVEDVCHAETPQERGRARNVAMRLVRRGATAEEVRARAARVWGTNPLTPAKLLRLWDRLA